MQGARAQFSDRKDVFKMAKTHDKKKTKRVVALFLVLLLALPGFTSFASATETTPYYNNIVTASSVATVSGSGYLEITNQYMGQPGSIDHVVIETKVEKQSFGIFWPDVDGGTWTDTLYKETYAGSHGVQLPERGTYRVTVEFTAYGKDGTKDNIRREYRKEY